MSTRETKISRRLLLAGGSAFGLGLLGAPASSQSAEKITYLFPAPPILPAFGPIRLAQGKGYFTAAGLEVSFAVGRGGVDVAKQVGAGNAPLGGIVADGPIMVRGNGVPVKIVAVFGGKGFMQLVVREDSGIEKPADLKGKTITVMSYQDQAAGVKVKVIPTDEYFPHMAQGIAVSDQIIKDKPEMVRKFVHAALHGMKDIMDDPNKATDDFVRFVPEWKGKEGAVRFALNMYAKLVYPGQKEPGEVNAERLAKLQEFYLAKGFIQKATPVEELYSNAFIK